MGDPGHRCREAISIHSPRMGRDAKAAEMTDREAISIHSPRMGRDASADGINQGGWISIHSPRMGRDRVYVKVPEKS